MLGAHNVQNALGAVAVAREMGVEESVIRRALANFAGVKRRFTKTGEAGGVTVIDDYAHHPVEIAAVLGAARNACSGRIIAVVQPHRFTRLKALFEEFCGCFNDADVVIVADVHPAGELPVDGINRDALVSGLRARGHRSATPLGDTKDLAALVASQAAPGDMVICLGAGTVTAWAHDLPGELEAIYASNMVRHSRPTS